MSIFQIKRIAAVAVVCAALIVAIASCKKDNFDVQSPGANLDPVGIHATMTIRQFQQAYGVPAFNSYLPVMLHDSVIISGIVNADDHSGNFYKTLTLQDSTGGIQIKIGNSYLYQDYPIGRRIFIKTKGLLIFNYSGTYELGGYIDTTTSTYPNVGPIVSTNASNYVIKGQWGLDVPVRHVTIRDINFPPVGVDFQSTLIQVDSVQFGSGDTIVPYGNALTKGSVNHTLYDCAGNGVVVRSSGYADFATQIPNRGHGSLKGVYSFYSVTNTPQISLRDTTDVMFYNANRCF